MSAERPEVGDVWEIPGHRKLRVEVELQKKHADEWWQYQHVAEADYLGGLIAESTLLEQGRYVDRQRVEVWVCEKCGQRLSGPAALCNSGIHVGPGDGEEAQGEAVLLADSKFESVFDPEANPGPPDVGYAAMREAPVGRQEHVEAEPVDCRGVPIRVGDRVVVAGQSGRLHERLVKAIERPGRPGWWVNIRFGNGDYTTPERLAVVVPYTEVEPLEPPPINSLMTMPESRPSWVKMKSHRPPDEGQR